MDSVLDERHISYRRAIKEVVMRMDAVGMLPKRSQAVPSVAEERFRGRPYLVSRMSPV